MQDGVAAVLDAQLEGPGGKFGGERGGGGSVQKGVGNDDRVAMG